jgi:hypothetical protein
MILLYSRELARTDVPGLCHDCRGEPVSWSLSASGQPPAAAPPDPANPDAAPAQTVTELELELTEKLHAILADPKYWVTQSSFDGSHVRGSLHESDS